MPQSALGDALAGAPMCAGFRMPLSAGLCRSAYDAIRPVATSRASVCDGRSTSSPTQPQRSCDSVHRQNPPSRPRRPASPQCAARRPRFRALRAVQTAAAEREAAARGPFALLCAPPEGAPLARAAILGADIVGYSRLATGSPSSPTKRSPSPARAISKLPIPLRRVHLQRDNGKTLSLLTNDMTRSAVAIAALYKARWQIDLLFRWIKQHLKFRKFLGHSENAIKLQIYAAVIAYALHVSVRRKGLALADGLYGDGAGFGRDLVRDLRRLIERVRDGEADSKAVRRLIDAIKWSCQCNRHEIEQKVRDLANEILNDWDAVIAFVHDPRLPPTNNDAERALRHAVIARRISYGTRSDEGSRFYAAGLSIIETCRKRGLDPWTYARDLIAAARAAAATPAIPATA